MRPRLSRAQQWPAHAEECLSRGQRRTESTTLMRSQWSFLSEWLGQYCRKPQEMWLDRKRQGGRVAIRPYADVGADRPDLLADERAAFRKRSRPATLSLAAMRKPTTSIRLSGRTHRATRTGIPRAPAPVCRASGPCRRCQAAGDPAAGGMVDPGRTPFPSSQPMTASVIRPSVETSRPGGRQPSPRSRLLACIYFTTLEAVDT